MEAGPSRSTTTTNDQAQSHPLPQTHFYSVEYPGYVQPASVPQAIRNLGGPSSLETAFRRGASKSETLVELKFQPDDSFVHPVPGEVVANNSIVIKITRRKRKGTVMPGLNELGQFELLGDFKAEAVGILHKTVRFRSMVDFQFLPDSDDPISRLRSAMDRMDVQAITSYRTPPEKEDYRIASESLFSNAASILGPPEMNIDPQLVEEGIDPANNTKPSSGQAFRSNLRLFPPPIFSRQGIAQSYNFKTNPASIVSTVVNEETGEEKKKRLINRMRWKGYGPATIAFSDPTAPDKPPTNVEAVREQVDKNILKKLDELFAQRPVWTRASLFNQTSATIAKEIHNSKVILPLVCYVFHDGPWRDTLVKLGYDPRKDPEGRFYQRLYFRNANHPINRPSVVTRRQERATTAAAATITTDPEKEEARTSHMFDGVNLTKETAAFQLCDITDVMLKEMIEDPDDVRDACDERDGWYSTHALERIKAVLRLKFFSLLDGRPATDEECQAVLEQAEMESSKAVASSRNAKMRLGKHNMAKGALRPEEAAAFRLRATLDREKRLLL
ncbi:RNA polymerase III transcription factor IIIC subunit-domain-containing protein [Lentinula aff. lateritia]|uniref:RNA polymerase III transcription factor IIIC subunit-domain-containing protein n=1 Tax=Lentinula aff. lateritia TaxID=2804960 RepID=A0ACC1TT20_9AGAR|nr:RNA polymerase III transcription factor IIIC subunit-domain-containing protein [Lentinula aff. lateritia]